MRLALKFIYRRSIPPLKQSNPVLIVGSKEKAVLTREALEIDRSARNKVIAFLDIKAQVNKNRLAGLPLYGMENLETHIVQHGIQAVILAKTDLEERNKERIATICKDYNINRSRWARKQNFSVMTLNDFYISYPYRSKSLLFYKIKEIKKTKKTQFYGMMSVF